MKRQRLQQVRALHPHPDRVRAPLFDDHAFFDPLDSVQVKYELLRQREVDGAPLGRSCEQFGFSRESYRQILERFRREGMAGLFGRKRGRRGPLKVNDELRQLIGSEHHSDPTLSPEQLAQRGEQRTGIGVSRRTIYRILGETASTRRKKKRQR